MIPEERGFLWPLEDVLNGNKEKDRKPIYSFIKEVEKYSGLVNIMLGIQNLVNKRSSHASGFIFLDDDPYEYSAFMRTPNWDIITQLDLHESEFEGLTKFDLLVTEISDKIVKTIELLRDDGIIKNKSLKENYNELLHPSIIDIKDRKIWNALGEGDVLNVFQFDTSVGGMAARKIKPQSPLEMTAVNALMRLMSSEKGAESPIDKYFRFKNNFPFLWENEMSSYGITEEERKKIEHIYAPSYGVPCLQEDLMILLMENANFSLKEANSARKIVAKKQMNKIPELRKMIFERVPHEGFANYLWDTGIKPQLG